MIKLQDISADTILFPWAKRAPRHALQCTGAIAIALLLGQVSGHVSAGAIAAGAAFTVGFAVFHEAMASTLISMAILTIGIASATLLGSLAAEWTWTALLVVVIASVNYGLLSELGPTPGWIGQQCGVFVIVASGFPRGVHYAVGRASMVVVGGLLQMLVYAVAYRIAPQTSDGTPRQESAETLFVRLGQRIEELWRLLGKQVREIRGTETFSYILRLSVTLILATLFYRHRRQANGYWAPMTALLVLRPQWSATLSRGTARLLGTVTGATFAVLHAMYLPLSHWLVFALVLLCTWASYTLQAVNYALFSFFLTLYVVYLFRFGGFSQPAAAHLRMLNTAIGGGIALVIDGLWLLVEYLRARSVPQPQAS